jgi:hypothetical protein
VPGVQGAAGGGGASVVGDDEKRKLKASVLVLNISRTTDS